MLLVNFQHMRKLDKNSGTGPPVPECKKVGGQGCLGETTTGQILNPSSQPKTTESTEGPVTLPETGMN
jgi:hypothetical protein